MGHTSSDSAKIKIGRYILKELSDAAGEGIRRFSKQELVAVGEFKRVTNVYPIVSQYFSGMFNSVKGYYIPNYDEFGGKEEYLKHLEGILFVLENPGSKEGWGGNSQSVESDSLRGEFGRDWTRRV